MYFYLFWAFAYMVRYDPSRVVERPRVRASYHATNHVRFRPSVFIGFIFGILGLTLLDNPAMATPKVSLIKSTARLDYQSTDGKPTMVLQVDGLDAGELKDPTLLAKEKLHDVGDPPLAKVDVLDIKESSSGTTARTWIVTLDIAGLPANSMQRRYLSVDVRGASTALEYTLTNKPEADFSWTVKAPASIAIRPGDPIPVWIAVGPVAATRLVLVGPYLTEKTTKALIAPKGLRLCDESRCDCNDDGSAAPIGPLVANSAAQLWICGASGIGQYDGTVMIASAEKPQGDAVTLSVSLTTLCLQGLGIAVIFVSALLTWFVTIFARNLVNRNQMLLPVSRLLGRLAAVQATVSGNQTGVGTPNLQVAIARLQNGLSEPQLQQLGLPPRVPAPWSAAPASIQADAYRNALQNGADWLAVLEVICQRGLAVLLLRWNGAQAAGQQAIRAAITALDAIANSTNAPALDAVRTQVQTQINTVNGINAVGGGATAVPSYDHLMFQITQFSAAAWLVVLLATTIVGSLALVLNSSFGSLTDFVTCIAWGLGVPIGGQAMTASFGTVATSLGISVAK